MKITTVILGTVGLASLLLASSADAASMVITRLPGTYWSNGGEINVTTPDGSLNGAIAKYDSQATGINPNNQLKGLQTFCIEYGVPAGSGNYDISGAAISGGSGGPSPDPISLGTAWLYSQFAQGTLAGYNYVVGAGREDSAGLLQRAIWWLEDEAGLSYDASNPFMAAVDAEFGANAKNNAGAENLGVWVINAGTREGGYARQDLLIWNIPGVPDGGATLILLGLGLSALGIIRRKAA